MAKTVLIIEDNPLNLELVCIVLESSGFRVLGVETAEEGLRLASEAHPDLILMDINLPGMDGLTATRRLKADPATASIPVVALTALAMAGDREKALQAGCNGYIGKPISIATLPQQVTALLGQTAGP